MKRKTDQYAEFADHPRYGRRPHITGLNPDPIRSDVQLHWNATTHQEVVYQFESVLGKKWPYGDFSAYALGKRIPNTAIAADTTKQTRATVPVTHYFDLDRHCRDCQRPFIFFAQEQKYWYEELGFGLESDCVRCVECRKKQQGIARLRERYETLFHIENKTTEQTLQMAEACISLIESAVFTSRQLNRVGMLLNTIPANADEKTQSRCNQLRSRMRLVITQDDQHNDRPNQ